MTPETHAALRDQLHRIIELVSIPARADEHPTRALLARLRALAADSEEHEAQPEQVVLGRLWIDLAGHAVTSAGRQVHLTHREFALLAFLARHKGRACTREQIVASVWSDRRLASSRTVDIHVYRLRTKLGEPFIELLETLRHVGYKLRSELEPGASEERISHVELSNVSRPDFERTRSEQSRFLGVGVP
jgi:DNA-binding winged helix-turn-helix (wHTH) protein